MAVFEHIEKQAVYEGLQIHNIGEQAKLDLERMRAVKIRKSRMPSVCIQPEQCSIKDPILRSQIEMWSPGHEPE